MRLTRATRFAAAAAALLFFAGTTGLSGLDALLFHRSGAPASYLVPHVERGGAPGHHADECMLTFRLANGRVSTPLPAALRWQGLATRPAAATPPAVPPRFYPGLHQQSRAPPPAPLA